MFNTKRVFDLFLVLLSLPLILPIYLLLALLVLAKFNSPILFKQSRPGLQGKIFNIYKFRSMTNESDKEGILLSDELRLTKFGKLLRSTSLDELPSLWNVLKGDMSLVGPRPLLVEYLPLYSSKQARRHEVKPGITGWAQVNGRNAISWDEKFDLDIWYVDNQSILLDIKINMQKKNFYLLDAQRHYIKNSFDFIIQSIGIYSNKELIKKSCDILENKFLQMLMLIESDDMPIVNSETTVDNCYDIILENEDYTMGNILEYIMYTNFYENEQILSFCGFKKMHPHDDDSILRLAFTNNVNKREIGQQLNKGCKIIIETIKNIRKLF